MFRLDNSSLHDGTEKQIYIVETDELITKSVSKDECKISSINKWTYYRTFQGYVTVY